MRTIQPFGFRTSSVLILTMLTSSFLVCTIKVYLAIAPNFLTNSATKLNSTITLSAINLFIALIVVAIKGALSFLSWVEKQEDVEAVWSEDEDLEEAF